MILNKRSLIVASTLLITLMLMSNVTQVKASLYIPYPGDKFSYSGEQIESQIQTNLRIITNSSTGDLLEYYEQSLDQKNIQDMEKAEFNINSISQTSAQASLTTSGYQNATGSHFINNTNYYKPEFLIWSNSSKVDNFTPASFSQTEDTFFNYTQGKTPSSLMLGPDMYIYVGLPGISLGNDNSNSGNQGCSSPSDYSDYVVNNGEIFLPNIYPFNDPNTYSLMGIFPSYSFNETEFGDDNLAYLSNHSSENITWTNVDIGLISGVNPAYNNITVVLVYHLNSNQYGMLNESAKYCPYGGDSGGGSIFDVFGNFSIIKLNWDEISAMNRPFNINGHQFLLNTKTEQGSNITSRELKNLNVSIGDSGSSFYAPVNLSLNINLVFSFEYDINTGFMVKFSATLNIKIALIADNILVPLDNSGTTGNGNMNMTMAMATSFNFPLQSHSSLYQNEQSSTTPVTTTPITTTSINTQSTSNNNTITTDIPTFVVFSAISLFVLVRRKFRR